MAFQLLLDYLTGQLALVNVPILPAVVGGGGGVIPVFFNLIPQ